MNFVRMKLAPEQNADDFYCLTLNMLNELISCCVIKTNTFIFSIFGHTPFFHSLFMAF